MRTYRFLPWELDFLTVDECVLLLQDPEKIRPPGGSLPMSGREMQAYAARHQAMSLREKLLAAKEGRL